MNVKRLFVGIVVKIRMDFLKFFEVGADDEHLLYGTQKEQMLWNVAYYEGEQHLQAALEASIVS